MLGDLLLRHPAIAIFGFPGVAGTFAHSDHASFPQQPAAVPRIAEHFAAVLGARLDGATAEGHRGCLDHAPAGESRDGRQPAERPALAGQRGSDAPQLKRRRTMALLKANQPVTNQKIFNREKTETRDDERMVGEKKNKEMYPSTANKRTYHGTNTRTDGPGSDGRRDGAAAGQRRPADHAATEQPGPRKRDHHPARDGRCARRPEYRRAGNCAGWRRADSGSPHPGGPPRSRPRNPGRICLLPPGWFDPAYRKVPKPRNTPLRELGSMPFLPEMRSRLDRSRSATYRPPSGRSLPSTAAPG